MDSKILMTLRGSKLTLKQVLEIREDGVYAELFLLIGKRLKMYLAYENIAQINVLRGVFCSDIEVINKGGRDNIIVRTLNKGEAEKAKELIDKKRAEVQSAGKAPHHGSNSSADEIKKLSELRDQKIITEEEFEAKKKQVLGL